MCVLVSNEEESCLSKQLVDLNLGYLFPLTGGVKIFLKAQLDHFVFGHI